MKERVASSVNLSMLKLMLSLALMQQSKSIHMPMHGFELQKSTSFSRLTLKLSNSIHAGYFPKHCQTS